MAPHNLRSHNVRVLFLDEVDGYEVTSEGSAVKLAIGRTMSYPNRKIVLGSTPKDKDTSTIVAAYNESDQRVFECPCPLCGGFTELKWQHIVWPKDRPEEAKFKCPHCESLIDERYKAQMVENGEWRITRPDVKNHAGYRLSALVSPLENARWGLLAADWLVAQGSPNTLRVFINQTLAEAWEMQSVIDKERIASHAENFDLHHLPPHIISMTAGIDVQDDRLEIVVCGWSKEVQNPACYVIHHRVVFGHFSDPMLWTELDEFLLSRFPHPRGGTIGFDGAVVDAGDGDHSGVVMDFCNSRHKRRHIWAAKGYWGATRARFAISKQDKQRFALIGVDALKGELFDKLQHGNRGMHFSNSLEPVFYQQLASEHRVVRLKSGMPVRRFERVSGGAKAEALDCLVYATASMVDVWKVMPFAERIARFKLHDTAPVNVYAGEGLAPELPDIVAETPVEKPLTNVGPYPGRDWNGNAVGHDGPRPRVIAKAPLNNPMTGRPIGSWFNKG